ncbi:MAG: TetR/AcrR family transcriptional regulator [Planctomycetota bacterium]|jgi:AcrR family transcriptional regulator
MTSSVETIDGREARGERTRTALLEAARKAFTQRGFAGASVRDIATSAGAHPALVRYHFGSKRKLFAAVIDDAMIELRRRIDCAIHGASTAGAGARQALVAYLDHLEANPDFPRLIQRGVLDRDPTVLSIAERHLRPLLALAGSLSAAAGREVQGRILDAALTLFGASVAPVLYAPLLEVMATDDAGPGVARARRRAHLMSLFDRLTHDLFVSKL